MDERSRAREHLQQGLSMFKRGDYEGSLHRFNECIALLPDVHQGYEARAASLERLGRVKEALKDTKVVVQLLPDSHKGYLRAARLLETAKKVDMALEMCDYALERVPADDEVKQAEVAALRARLVQEIARLQSERTCHAHRLPVELLSMIFTEWLKIEVAGPIKASHVCQYWRSVALSTSLLWTKLVLGRTRPEVKIATWMQRSLGRFTSLRVNKLLPRQSNPRGLATALVKGAHTLLELDMETRADMDGFQVFHSLASTVAQKLEVLRMIHLSTNQYEVSDFSSFSSLITLDLENFVLAPKPFTCAGLKVLRVDFHPRAGSSAIGLLFMISQLPALVELSFHSNGMRRADGVTPVHTTFPTLQRLELGGQADWIVFIDHISVPTLNTISLSRCRHSASEILAHLRPSELPIGHLHIHNTGFSEPELISHVSNMPRLESLTIAGSANLSNQLVETLAQRHTPPKWPKLEYLDVSNSPAISGGPLLRLVRNHLPAALEEQATLDAPTTPRDVANEAAIAPIHTLIIDRCPKVDSGALAKLRELVPRVDCVYLSKEEAKGTGRLKV